MSSKKVLLLSAYHTDSHRYWCQWLMEQLVGYKWTLCQLPGRYFSWRIRGNPLSWWQQEALQQNYDLVIATSTVDIATLKGLNPQLAQIPWLYYSHENQFSYPKTSQQHNSLEPQMVQIYGLLAAQTIVFNSQYNLHSCMAGLETLLKKFPDQVPKDLVSTLTAKSQVLPVPLTEPSTPAKAKQANTIPKLLWNHRWEYDKGPDLLLALVEELSTRKLDFQLTLLGRRFRQIPDSLTQLLTRYSDKVSAPEYLQDRDDYWQQLKQHDIVLSTTLHEFQGLAVQEAVLAGCCPLVPNRLAYPEIFPQPYRYASDKTETKSMADRLQYWFENQIPKPPAIEPSSDQLLDKYQLLLQQLLR